MSWLYRHSCSTCSSLHWSLSYDIYSHTPKPFCFLNFKSYLSNINYRGHVLFLSLCIPFNPPNIFNAWPFKQLLYQGILSLLVLACNDCCLTTLICTLWNQLCLFNFKSYLSNINYRGKGFVSSIPLSWFQLVGQESLNLTTPTHLIKICCQL